METVTGRSDQFLTDTLEERQADFRRWCDTVRDPATESTEGIREIISGNGSALAHYEIAELPSGHWAVRTRCEYRCGNYSGTGTPWTEFVSRNQCIDFFLSLARRHFGHQINRDGSSNQRSAQSDMKERLMDGLFGFIEPTPSSG